MRRRLARFAKRILPPGATIETLKKIEVGFEATRNPVAQYLPGFRLSSPRLLTIAITAKCNFSCAGCRYGRDYMAGHELPAETVFGVLEDSAAAGVSTVRLYGGEPLLHRELPEFVSKSLDLGMVPFISTNGFLLDSRIDELFRAGLRKVNFGYYGSENIYNEYVGRNSAWTRFVKTIENVNARFGQNLQLGISYVLNTRTCTLHELQRAWSLATKYSLQFHIDLVHYSLPYFSEGPNGELQFWANDRERIELFVSRLEEIHQERPDLYREPAPSIRSIPDWLLKKSAMRVPCDAYNMIWVGADGSVRLCFADFPLGNIHETRLANLLATKTYRNACRSALRLHCVNCHCGRSSRISKHIPSLIRYGVGWRGGRREVGGSQPKLFPIYPSGPSR